MNKLEKLSVIISFYNKDEPSQFRKALESIYQEQTLKPDKVIVVQDGPVSMILQNIVNEFILKFPDVFKLIIIDINKGLANALNEALKICNSEYIARMDSDDISSPDRFKKQIKFMDNSDKVSICGSFINEFDKDISTYKTISYPVDHKNIVNSMHKRSPFAHPTIIFRASSIKNIRYNQTLMNSQDIELWFRLINENIFFHNIPEPLLYYRMDTKTLSRRSFGKARNEFFIYMKGIYTNYGLSAKMIFPFARLLFRLLPSKLTSVFYKSNLRNRIS